MNDFSDIENDLRKLRPAQPSPVLFERIEEALAKHRSAPVAADTRRNWRRLLETPYNWGCGGFGSIRSNQFGTPAGARRKCHTGFICAGNDSVGACHPEREWNRTNRTLEQIYSCWRDAGRLQHARRGTAVYQRLAATRAAAPLSQPSDVAVA